MTTAVKRKSAPATKSAPAKFLGGSGAGGSNIAIGPGSVGKNNTCYASCTLRGTKAEEPPMIECSMCEGWVHYPCAQPVIVKGEEPSEDTPWYCAGCSTQKKARKESTCSICGQTGHTKPKCPDRHDDDIDE